MVSASISLPYSGWFSPFPHGTSSLSVSCEYLALADGAAEFNRDSSGPDLLRIPVRLPDATNTGLSPSLADVPTSFLLGQTNY
jgi:hypothetical protein